MINVTQVVDNYLAEEIKKKGSRGKPSGNWASNVGHPCARYLVYCRLNYNEKDSPGAKLQRIFREGNMHEADTYTLLTQAGLKVTRPMQKSEWASIETVGWMDWCVKDEKSDANPDGTDLWIPMEFKSISPYDYAAINSIDDMVFHKKWYIRKWPGQLLIYMLIENKEFGMIMLKNKVTGELKQINFKMEGAVLELAETYLKKLDIVNKCVKEGHYPERIDDRSVCDMCDFAKICIPDELNDSIQFLDDDALKKAIDEYFELKPLAERYEEVNDSLKEEAEKKGKGNYIVGNKYEFRVAVSKGTKYVVPDDIKKQYAEETVSVRKKILRIGDTPVE